MKGNTLNKLVMLCCVLAIFGCKAKKLVVTNNPHAPAVKPRNELEAKLNTVRAKQVSFNTFSAKARTNLNIDGNTNDCTLNIRINNGKQIWVSITALLGIEVARARITPDSILIINKLQGVYVKKPFSYIYTYTNKQVNYDMLQALLVGNAVPSLLNDSTKFDNTGTNITLTGNLSDIVYKLVIGAQDMKVAQTNLSSQNQDQSLQISNSTFIQSGNQKVPSQIDITSVAKNKKIQVNLRYVKVDFNLQQDYPFAIPENYSPAD